MTTIAAGPLSDALQALIDARLDTIDRMLLGRVSRQDRLAIVREVESQIFDLLPQSGAEGLDRDDVLAVLARLDPPEAYLPEESTGQPATARTIPRPAPPPRTGPSRLSLAGGILGMISTFLVVVAAVMISVEFDGGLFDSEELSVSLILATILSGFITAILALVFAARVRVRGAWAVVGLITGILSLISSLIAAARVISPII